MPASVILKCHGYGSLNKNYIIKEEIPLLTLQQQSKSIATSAKKPF